MVIPRLNSMKTFSHVATHLTDSCDRERVLCAVEQWKTLYHLCTKEVNINILTEVYSNHTVMLCMSKCVLLLQ